MTDMNIIVSRLDRQIRELRHKKIQLEKEKVTLEEELRQAVVYHFAKPWTMWNQHLMTTRKYHLTLLTFDLQKEQLGAKAPKPIGEITLLPSNAPTSENVVTDMPIKIEMDTDGYGYVELPNSKIMSRTEKPSKNTSSKKQNKKSNEGDSGKKYPCNTCCAMLESLDELNEHIMKRKHTIHCKNPKCKRVFKYKSSFMNHITQHVNAKVYACPLCDKKCKKAPKLQKHMHDVHWFTGSSTKTKPVETSSEPDNPKQVVDTPRPVALLINKRNVANANANSTSTSVSIDLNPDSNSETVGSNPNVSSISIKLEPPDDFFSDDRGNQLRIDGVESISGFAPKLEPDNNN